MKRRVCEDIKLGVIGEEEEPPELDERELAARFAGS